MRNFDILLDIKLIRKEFSNKFYLQLKGTTIKKFTPMTPTSLWQHCFIIDYFRYLDDILGVWDYSREEFQVFVQKLNHFNTSVAVGADIPPDYLQNATKYRDWTRRFIYFFQNN